MKKIILASVLVAAASSAYSAASQTFCGGTAGSGQAVTLGSAAATSDFVKSTFTPKCSANTFVSGEDLGSAYRVGSTSSKGKTRYAGGAGGGAVVAAGTCNVPTACAATDATAAMQSTYAATS
jgi:hypothetical protein